MAPDSAFFDPRELFLFFIQYTYLFSPQHEDHQHLPDFGCPELSQNNSSSSASSNASISSSNPETEHVNSSIEIEETFQVESSIETEEPLQVIICEICTDTKRITQMIKNQTCHHSYCSDCMTKHVAAKIQNSIIAVPCPGLDCKSVFELEACRPWLPKDLFERWDKARCEVLLLQVPKFYCPFEDCSAMMLVENEKDQQTAGKTECPVCHRVFCPRCNVPWHTGVDCKKYQKLNKNKRQSEDRLVRKLAKEKRWQRCPKCKFYVEKISGCVRITCRCKYKFCYVCGREWDFIHEASRAGCTRNRGRSTTTSNRGRSTTTTNRGGGLSNQLLQFCRSCFSSQ
ncbi:hypothetical protein K1719_027717 [Acacia pycnantha]|nr:hypothetical protein K1719_027717 [Acacia pycnantha]